jgi:hypothetical protein
MTASALFFAVVSVLAMPTWASNLTAAAQTSLRNIYTDLYQQFGGGNRQFQNAIQSLGLSSTVCKTTGLEYLYSDRNGSPRSELFTAFKCDEMSRLTAIDLSLNPKANGNAIQLTKYYMERWFSGMPDLTKLVLENGDTDVLSVDVVGNLSAPLTFLSKLQTCVLPPPTASVSVCCTNGTSPFIPDSSPCLASFVSRLNGGAAQDQCVYCCTNQRRDNGEVNVDCGGPCHACVANATACFNGIQDNTETGVDCGGGCVSCCENGIRDANEDGIDCGSQSQCGRYCNCAPAACNRPTSICSDTNICTTSASLESCGSPECAAKACSNVYAGWFGRGCRMFQQIGICSRTNSNNGACRSTPPNVTECGVIGRVNTADAFVCDTACQRADSCKAGTTRPATGVVLATVCKVAGESCGDQLICNRQGRCVPQPQCGACEAFMGTACTAACARFPCDNNICIDASDNDTCTATVASASVGVCNTYTAAKGVCTDAKACSVQCIGSRPAITCDAMCGNATNPCVADTPLGALTADDVCVGDGRGCGGSNVCLLGGKCRAATLLSLFLERLNANATSSNSALRDRVRAAASAFLISLPRVADTGDESWKTLSLHVSEATMRKRAMSDDLTTALLADPTLATLGWAVRESRPSTTTTKTSSGGNTPGTTGVGSGTSGGNGSGTGTQGSAGSGAETTTTTLAGGQSTASGGEETKTDDAVGDDESTEFPVAAVVGGIAGGLCLIILIAMVVVLAKRRRADDHPSSLSAIKSSNSTEAADSAALFFDEDDEPLQLKSETKESIYASATGFGEYGKAPEIST